MKRHTQQRVFGAALLAMFVSGPVLAAEDTNDASGAPACKTAEVNPVTGHVFCIDPLGAPVEAPPSDMKPECDEKSRGQWTWAPNCQPAIEGM